MRKFRSVVVVAALAAVALLIPATAQADTTSRDLKTDSISMIAGWRP